MSIEEEHRPSVSGDSDDDQEENDDFRQLVAKQNKKKKKSGGFQSMGLDRDVFRGVVKKGYRVPTPIQRKTIPLILEGRDVVAMARTGSGKTACFLLPMFQRLKMRSAKSGARALILSPTKELALQTRKFTGELGRYTGLRSACVLGGESMEKQFALLHENPDIVIATPGRFVHICVEMGLRLDSIEYVVFDEADRLFEMGFGEQLREILGRLPAARQTVLFSATLPKLLVDFARAGLSDPSLIRLDVDSKIPDTLRLAFFHCRPEGKPAALVHLVSGTIIPADQQIVVFCATRHHVEYVHLLLDAAGVDNTFVYSHLDATARKINSAKFATKKSRVLVVTDLAARGLDIPFLDNVINYSFPAQPKLFVHRVGRVARAGRTGTAYSLVAGDELAYFIDLQLFLGNSVRLVGKDDDWHNVLGTVPQSVYDRYADQLAQWHENQLDLTNAKDVADKGWLKYLKSRPPASTESIRRVKKMKETKIEIHPLFKDEENEQQMSVKRESILEEMKRFRPHATIFEIGNSAKNAKVKSVMSVKRSVHGDAIQRFQQKIGSNDDFEAKDTTEEPSEKLALTQSSQEDIAATFGTVVESKKSNKVFLKRKKKSARIARDDENYIGYRARDHHSEAGLSMMSNFDAQAKEAVLDLTGDDDDAVRSKKNAYKWDAKKRKYINQAGESSNKKKIKTESGVWIPASYKSDRYSRWKEKTKLAQQIQDEEDNDENQAGQRTTKRKFSGLPASHPAMKKAQNALPKHKKGPKMEIKRPEQVLKQRKLQERQRRKNMRKDKRKKMKH